MNFSTNLIEKEVANILLVIRSRGIDFEEAAAREVARLRILEAVHPFISLRYVHSESKLNQLSSEFLKDEVVSSFTLLGLDAETFLELVENYVRRIGTTRPDGFWRACGVGRPKGKKK